MKITIILQVDNDENRFFEGETKDLFKRDILNIVNSEVPQLQLKFGDSGNVVAVYLQKKVKS